MEAKDTVMTEDDLCRLICSEHRANTLEGKNCDGLDCNQCQLGKQAQISFKVGKTAGVAESLIISLKAIEASRKAGIGEVVEWLKDSRANGDFVLDFESDWWLNRLKEWGIDGKL